MIKPILLTFIFILALNAEYLKYGIPLDKSTDNRKSNSKIVDNKCYILSANFETKFADWVAYKLNEETVNSEIKTFRRWKKDPKLDNSETLEPKDYKGAYKALTVDRGHQAPLASFKGTDCWKNTNYLSNITPQQVNLNRGAWKKLEDKVRKFVNKGNTVYVLTGTLYKSPMPKLPNTTKEHIIPSGYWKIILFEDKNKQIHTASFKFSQFEKRKASLPQFITTIDEIEEQSNFDFFSELDDKQEKEIESKDNKSWVIQEFLN